MKDPYKKEFTTSMVKEVIYPMDNGNYYIITRSPVPTGAIILPAVWKMK